MSAIAPPKVREGGTLAQGLLAFLPEGGQAARGGSLRGGLCASNDGAGAATWEYRAEAVGRARLPLLLALASHRFPSLCRERHGHPLRVESIVPRAETRVIFGKQLATRKNHDALGYELEDGPTPVKRA